MKKTTYHIPQMDCASEEQLIRLKLRGIPDIRALAFDIPNRCLAVYHDSDTPEINQALGELGLGARALSTEEHGGSIPGSHDDKKLLWRVLLINAALFVTEMIAGLEAHSMGLIADSLDMLADTSVYGLSLYAVGQAVLRQKAIARFSGYVQLGLAFFGIAEVIRRFLGFGEVPEFRTMMVVSVMALAGNWISLVLLQRSKSAGAHIQASMIFTNNDVIVNAGVIVAGALVWLTGSGWPDLVVGMIVFILVVIGAARILKLAK